MGNRQRLSTFQVIRGVIANERVKVMGHASYMDRAFTDRSGIVAEAETLLQGVEFDSFVGIGLSGTLVAPLLADMFTGTHGFAIVRKSDDDSTHSSHRIEGEFDYGTRFVFVDDLVDSGATLLNVLMKIDNDYGDRDSWDGEYHKPTMAGAYLYQHDYQTGKFLTVPELIHYIGKRTEFFRRHTGEECIRLLTKYQ